MAARLQEFEADPDPHLGLLRLKMLPDVLGKQAADAVGPKKRLPVRSLCEIELGFLRPNSSRVILRRRPDDHTNVVVAGHSSGFLPSLVTLISRVHLVLPITSIHDTIDE